MNNMKFKTSTTLDYYFNTNEVSLLNTDNELVKVPLSMLDLMIKHNKIDLMWEVGLEDARESYFNLSLKVPDQKIETEIDIEVDCDYSENKLLIGDYSKGYQDFDVVINLKDIHNKFNGSRNPFESDFAPSDISFRIIEIKQTTKDTFELVVDDVEVEF